MTSCRSNFNCAYYFGSDHLKQKRAEKLKCKSKRINVLAQPKNLTEFKVDELPKIQKVQVIREYALPTRIKMLAIPKVRRLVSSLEEYKELLSSNHIKNYDELIQRSIMTMYSRLANVHMKKQRKLQEKWTKADWDRNCKWMKQRAHPKVYEEIKLKKKEPNKVVPLKQLMKSIKTLSQPRNPRPKYRKSYGYHPTVKDSTRVYIPSKRLLKLAEAKERMKVDKNAEEFYIDPFQVNPNALKFTLTDRLKELSKSRYKPTPPPEISDFTDYGVIKRALKAQLTTRTEELSKPRVGDEEDEKPKPLVSKSALKAKPTQRILELSKPREYPN